MFHSPGRNSILMSGLPQPCQEACLCAVSKLEAVSKQLQTGEISVSDLHMINTSQQEMKRLCDAADEMDNKSTQTSNSMDLALQSRLKEYGVFVKQNGFLLHLCNKIPNNINGEYINILMHWAFESVE